MKVSFNYPYRICCEKCGEPLEDPMSANVCPPDEHDFKNFIVEVQVYCLDCSPRTCPWMRLSELFVKYSYYEKSRHRKAS